MRRAAWLALLLLGAGCSPEPRAPEPEPAAAEGARIVAVDAALIGSGRIATAKVEARAISGALAATGTVEAPPTGAADVTSPLAARVKQIFVLRGDPVKAGELLATLEAADLARVASDLGRARAQRVHAERVLSQEQRLLGDGATSQRAVSEAQSELDMARADERAASRLLGAFGARGNQLALRSPIDGCVVRVQGVTGAPVEATAPLFRVVDTSRLVLRVDVPEDDAEEVPLGSRANLASASGRSCSGVVESHAPSVDPKTRTVPFRITPAPECGELHEGAFFDVSLERAGRERRELPAVPRDAVVSIDEVPVVFVPGARPGEFSPRTIRVAEYAGLSVFVEDGLRPGELVVTKGAILLKGELLRARLE
jgi:membrane fusion protein, heavy metal efflux system